MRRGRITAGTRFTFYGPEAVGKSSLAAHAPSPLFLDVEDGTSNLEVARYTFRDGPHGHVPESIEDVAAAIRDLRHADHDYRTLVIDTLDRLEALIWAHLIERDSTTRKPLTSIESFGYGKGYVLALDQWRSLCARLDDLRLHRGMNIILLAHATIRTFRNPEGDDYDRWHLRIHDKAAGFIKEWSDVVGYCCFEEGGSKLEPSDHRARGYSTGRRLIRLARTAAYDAKSRIALPDEVELAEENPWAPLAAAVAQGLDLDPAHLRSAIAAELMRLGDAELSRRVEAAVTGAKDNTADLSRYLTALCNRQPNEDSTHE